MIKQREILQFLSRRTQEGKDSSFRSLVGEFDISPESACGHLKRLWREGLIRSTEDPPRRRPSLAPGESIRDLRFRLVRRGRRRLEWYAKQDAKDDEEGLVW